MGTPVEKGSKFISNEFGSWILPGFEEYNCTDANITSTKGPSVSQFLSRKFELLKICGKILRF